MNILFVCTGNTCRSPMAQYYLNSLNLPGITAQSAGIYAGGEAISENSARAMEEIGINAYSHISQPITAELINNSDKIYCMTPSHKSLLLSLGIKSEMISVLKDNGISDPFGGDLATYRSCRDEIIASINDIFNINPYEVLYLESTDIAGIARLEQLCFSQPWSEKAINESMKGKNTFLGIKENGKLIGYLSFFEALKEAYINNIAVDPDFRRKGVAHALLSELINLAFNLSFEFISLEVRQSNSAAIRLYTAFGFKKEGSRKNFYDAPKEDAIILTRRF